MPGFDGTGPLGQGPFTGCGRGFCIMTVDNANTPIKGFMGSQNYPINMSYRNPQVSNNYMKSLYQYYPYQVNPIGYKERPENFFRRRSSTGVNRRGRRFWFF